MITSFSRWLLPILRPISLAIFVALVQPLRGATTIVDGSFDIGSGANERVLAIAVQKDGKMLIGGWFSSVNGVSRNRIARINPDGSVDTTFNPGLGANGFVGTIALQNDGKVLIGGLFSSVNNVPMNGIARLRPDGTVDTSFNPGAGANDQVYALLVQSDGRIVLGGMFTGFNNIERFYVARLHSNGSVDTSFAPSPNGPVLALAQAGTSIILGGGFTAVNDELRSGLAEVMSDGDVDPVFASGGGADGAVHALVVQPDQKILVGGFFTRLDGIVQNKIGRLNSDGSPDLGFNPGAGANGFVRTIALQTDGRIFVAGDFTAINGLAYNYLARLNRNGSVDQTFKPGDGPNNLIWAVAVQADGKPLIGGNFTSVAGKTRRYFARLRNTVVTTKFLFSASTYSLPEGGGSAAITVLRTGDLGVDGSVSYSTTSGSATPGPDYLAKTATLFFGPGQSQKTFKIKINNDAQFEGDETFGVQLANPTAPAGLGSPATALVKIIDDDPLPPTIVFGAAAYSVNEGQGKVAVTVTRIRGKAREATVEYTTLSDTAASDIDFITKGGILQFAPGETSKTLNINILNDTRAEPNETFRVKLFNPTGGFNLGEPSEAVVTIFDDEG